MYFVIFVVLKIVVSKRGYRGGIFLGLFVADLIYVNDGGIVIGRGFIAE